jgi:exonuclease SbcD
VRFLHTSDWHVGKALRDRDRVEEFAAVLDEVVRIASDQKVDAVLVSGDIFEHKGPRPDSERLVYDTFARFHEARTRVVAITGNHDSQPRWTAVRAILDRLGVTIVAEVAPPGRGTAIEVPSRDGRDAAVVACIPFAAERHFITVARLFEGSEAWPQDYAQGMGDLMTAMATSFKPDCVNVLLGHLFAAGAELGGSETPVSVSIDYMVAPSRIPGSATYVALGHIHRSQQITASPSPTYYAGSLLQLDFGERSQKKSVRIVDAKPGQPAVVTEVLLGAGRQLVDVNGTLAELQQLAAPHGDAFLRVRVKTAGPVPGIADHVRQILPNAVDIRVDYERTEDEVVPGPSLIGLAPRAQYALFYREKYKTEASAETLAAFDELHASVDAEQA